MIQVGPTRENNQQVPVSAIGVQSFVDFHGFDNEGNDDDHKNEVLAFDENNHHIASLF